MPVKIKLCGMFRPEEIAAVNEAGPDYCGFIIDLSKSHRSISPTQVRQLRGLLRPDILPCGVFVNAPMALLSALVQDGTLAMVQLHGAEDDAYIKALRERIGAVPIIKAVQLSTPAAIPVSCAADYLLLDSGQGSGVPLDWSRLPAPSAPFFLAGGLTPENLPLALSQCKPRAVDLSSGIETNKLKDPKKMRAAVAAVRRS